MADWSRSMLDLSSVLVSCPFSARLSKVANSFFEISNASERTFFASLLSSSDSYFSASWLIAFASMMLLFNCSLRGWSSSSISGLASVALDSVAFSCTSATLASVALLSVDEVSFSSSLSSGFSSTTGVVDGAITAVVFPVSFTVTSVVDSVVETTVASFSVVGATRVAGARYGSGTLISSEVTSLVGSSSTTLLASTPFSLFNSLAFTWGALTIEPTKNCPTSTEATPTLNLRIANRCRFSNFIITSFYFLPYFFLLRINQEL